MDFSQIPQFPQSRYSVDISWKEIEFKLARYNEGGVLQLDPAFQRLHVWTPAQQTAFIEFKLKGGTGGEQIYFSQADWGSNYSKPMYLVDGKQRLEAIRGFMRGDVLAFGVKCADIQRLQLSSLYLKFNVAALKTEAEVIHWYIGINAGGTAHTSEEIDKAKSLLTLSNT